MSKWLYKYKHEHTANTMSTLSVPTLSISTNKIDFKIPIPRTDKTDSVGTPYTTSTLSVPTLDISTNKMDYKIPITRTDKTDSVNKVFQSSAYQTRKITKKVLQNFLGEYWPDYAGNPEALKIWAEIIAQKEIIIGFKILTEEEYENLFK